MAVLIWTNVLNKKISIDELFKWLTAENPEDTISPEIAQNGSTRAEFVSHFLNYLREQCRSILPDAKVAPEKPPKKLTQPESQSPAVTSRELPAGDARGIVQQTNRPGTTSTWRNKDYKSRHGGQPIHQPRNPLQEPKAVFSPPSDGREAVPMGPMMGNPSSMGMPPGHFPPLSHQLNSNLPVPNAVMHQMPQVQANPHPHSPQFSQQPMPQNSNPGCIPQAQETMSPRHSLNNSGGGKFPDSFYSSSNSMMNQAQAQMGNLNVSSPSGGFDNSFSNASVDTNSPQRSVNSMMNGSSILNSSNTPFSPMSPLYANNISNLCPKRHEKSLNETANSQDISSSSANASKACSSTPNNGSGQKASKSGQGQARCLGDFMTSEKSGSKKVSRKQMRTQLWRSSQGESGSPADKEKSKRRINPTRLDVSADTGNLGKEVFGVISRPTAANPKFVEAPSTDKSVEEVSFEVERGLLKLERQRQPKSESTIESANVEQKLSTKSSRSSTIVPSLDLVENIEMLNILARLYSGILDRNLMPNPMTELYFLVTLLTTQYKETAEKTPKKRVVIKEKSKTPDQLLESLEDDLGCAELTEEISEEIVGKESTDVDGKLKNDSVTEDTQEHSALNTSIDSSETRHENDKDKMEKYLESPHNCVYFATIVMLEQRFLLQTLDRASLKMLCENQQIAAFQPELQKYLNEIYGAKCLQSNRIKQSVARNLQTNVCFQVDTDNRETFPSVVAFSLFRKQRDLFYDILKTWEDYHLSKDWLFERALKNKINTLLTFHTDPVNQCHFAKLFISQLLISSLQTGQTEDPMNDESLSFLKSLKQLNPEKLMQLKERLVTPLTSSGPVPLPVFPGVQEFYREFILHASNWKFYVILEMSLIREIVELNETNFTGSEIEGTGTTVDERTKQKFITCVSSLRLLAKFLSFTVSLPFQTALNSSEWCGLQIQLRTHSLPSLDIRGSLEDALTRKKLSLTVPWIVQYMAMLDSVTLRLPYYANVGELLYRIYRMSNNSHSTVSDESVSSQTAILMMFTIGWLFDLPNFPRDLYAYWQMSYDEKKLRIVGRLNYEKINGNELIPGDADSSKEFVTYNSNVDKLDIIDDRALYECCPFLAEFKVLLISGNAVLGNNSANRHITPVSSQLSQPTFGVKTKNLQMQLEEAFFHGQPSSIRRTVDFVSERVASSCVKYICNSIIPSAKERNMKAFIKSKYGELDFAVKDEEDDEEKPPSSPARAAAKISSKSKADKLEHQIQGLATTIMNDVKKECREKIPGMCETRSSKSIGSLLADDAFPCVEETCIAITRRTAMERIDQWIESHVVESLFLKNMTFELKRLLKEGEVDQADREDNHNPDAPCPTEVIGMMRNSMWELLEKQGRWSKLSVKSVKTVLTCFKRMLSERGDLIDYSEKNLFTMSVEYCLLLLTNKPDLYTTEIQRMFLDIWKLHNARGSESDGLFVRIISPRNIRLVTDKSKSSALEGFSKLLKGLLQQDLLSIEALSEQCVALFRQEWPTPILKQLSACLNDVVHVYKSSSAHAERVKSLLSWIASTCDEMEICDYD